ncbi:hypothetical protein [Micromonospora sp. S4605]|uniref:hypothetical protein n=1 Tax=Micromonospora sp. S4605 TaxID=1420897 RepID=UPI000D6F48F1|nr:hypothetical protein [Micromonospora sp. S4605]
MAYDAVAESVRLIADGPPAQPVRLSRRRRFAPVAADVDGDVAATRFLRRSTGCFCDEIHLLVRNGNDGWRRLGGGGSSNGYEDRTAEAFERARNDLSPHQVVVNGGPAVLRDHLLPWTGRWVRAATLLAGGGIAQLVVGGRRLPIPYHGHLVVVWGSRRPPSVTARDATGRTVVTVTLSNDR